MNKRNRIGIANIALFFLLAGMLVLLLAYGRGLTEKPPDSVSPTAASVLARAAATSRACQEGGQREFSCVGEISGKQTYYACVNGSWKSESRYNESCVRAGWVARVFNESASINAAS